MDIGVSGVTGGVRIALQVVTNFKRPVLEIYTQLRHISAPPIDLPITNYKNEKIGTQAHRITDLFFELSLANIGGKRAENIRIQFRGNQDMFIGSDVPKIVNGVPIQVLPPGQILQLFRVDSHKVEEEAERFTITVEYDGPRTGLNRMVLWAKFWKRSQYVCKYSFDTELYAGYHVPSPEYNG